MHEPYHIYTRWWLLSSGECTAWEEQQPWMGQESAYTVTKVKIPWHDIPPTCTRIVLEAGVVRMSDVQQNKAEVVKSLMAGEHIRLDRLSGFPMDGPLPVRSLPICIMKKAMPKKQSGHMRAYCIGHSLLSQDSHQTSADPATLHLHEHASFDLDKKIWDGGLGICRYLTDVLCSNLPKQCQYSADLKSVLQSSRPKTIVELGTGTGLASIILATLLRRSGTEGNKRIFATDLATALPLLESNILDCGVGDVVQARELDWDSIECTDRHFGWGALEADIGPCIDLVLAADVTYNTSSFPSLLRTFRRLLRPPRASSGADQGASPEDQSFPIGILAYKMRDAAERTLWTMAGDFDLELQLLQTIGAHEERQGIEVWAVFHRDRP